MGPAPGICLIELSVLERELTVFVSSFDWFTGMSVSFVIGQRDYVGFGL